MLRVLHLAIVMTLSVAVLEVYSHSYLTNPLPRSDQGGGCRVGHPTNMPQYDTNCPGPCENIGRINNSISATWQRGSTVTVRWAKNNHQGGFVRWSIVKKDDMMNKQRHADLTFAYSCWDSTRVTCQGGFECGTDEQKIAFTEQLKVPAVYPDGEYILGWAWFGAAGDLSDYHSCANIRIQGGPQENSYAPITARCQSKTETLGDCPREPCVKGGLVSRVPKKFASGQPAPISAASFGAATNNPAPAPAPAPVNNNPAPAPANQNKGVNLEVGATYRIKPSHAAGSCLDATGRDNGAFVQIWGCWTGENQKWKLERLADGSYKFSQANGAKVLDVARAKNGGERAQIWDSWDSDNQRWTLTSVGDGSYVIRSVHSKLVLSVLHHSANNGARIEQRTWNGAGDQKWRFEKV